MFQYINKLIDELPDIMVWTAKTPATSQLFPINQDCTKLTEKKAQLFHHLVTKLLYLCRCTRQDIQTAVAFLCTRVKNPDTDDYKNAHTHDAVSAGNDKSHTYN